MKKLSAALLLVLGWQGSALAQKSPTAIQNEINSQITSNGAGAITGLQLNGILNDMNNSYANLVAANNFTPYPQTFLTLALSNGVVSTSIAPSPSTVVPWTLTLPTSGGTSGYVLSTNGAGITSWVPQTGGGGGGSLAIGSAISGAFAGYGLYSDSGSLLGQFQYGSSVLAALSLGLNGSGALAATTSPTFVTPTLGAASATSINKVAITAPATNATLTIGNSKTLTVNNSLTLSGTDATTMTFPGSNATLPGIGLTQTWTGAQTFANSNIILLGSSTGGTTLTSANAGASNYTLTLPALTATVATTSGAIVNGHCASFNANGQLVDAGGTCTTGGGGGTVASSTIGQVPVYTGATTVTGGTGMTFATGALTLGVANSQAGTVVLNNTGAGGAATLASSATTTSPYTFTLPVAPPPASTGYVLTSTTAGVTSWTASGGGGSGTVNSGTAGALAYYPASAAAVSSTTTGTGVLSGLANNVDAAGGFLLTDGTATLTNKTFDTAGAGNVLKINGTAVSAVTGSGSVVLATSPTLVTPNIGVATGTSLNLSSSALVADSSGNLKVTGGLLATGAYSGPTYSSGLMMDYASLTGRFFVGASAGFAWYNAANTTPLSLMTLSSVGSLANIGTLSSGANGGTGGQLTLYGSSTGSGVIGVAAAAGSGIYFQLPTSNGSNGNVLQTDGAGHTSWVAPTGSTPLNSQTTSYTITGSDIGGTVEMTCTANCTVTLPSGLTNGGRVDIVQANAATYTVQLVASGTTLRTASSWTYLAGQYSAVTCFYKTSGTAWTCYGGLSPS